jgi:hypothetical protein
VGWVVVMVVVVGVGVVGVLGKEEGAWGVVAGVADCREEQ